MSRPTIAPELLAALTGDAPKRLIRKLDEDPQQAAGWEWVEAEGAWRVTSPKGEVVELRHALLSEPEHVGCSCLLAPRCLHLLATLSVLELAEEVPGEADASPAEGPPPEAGSLETGSPEAAPAGLALSASQRDAAERAWRAGVELLVSGAAGAGAALQAELLRSVHAARVQGLHRLASSGLRLVKATRELRSKSASGQLTALTDEAARWLEAAWLLRREGGELAGALGQSRRSYAQEGSLRLWGVASEAVLSRGGYAGVVTLLCDDEGRGYTLSNVRPGESGRALGAYDAGAEVGDLALSHRELGRAGLILQGATASQEGRLGSGKSVKAVRASGAAWGEVLAPWLKRALAEQAAEAAAALDLPPAERRAGSDLLAGEARVLGASAAALWLEAWAGEGAHHTLEGVVLNRSPALPALENLKLLARSPGLRLRWLGRCDPLVPGRVALIAIGPPAEEESPQEGPRLVLPEAWGGRCNLSLDRLSGANLEGIQRTPHRVEASAREDVDPLTLVRRRLERLALGGRSTLMGGVQQSVARDRARLSGALYGAGGVLLGRLAAAAAGEGRRVDGTLSPPDVEGLGRAFVAAATYERAARRARWAQGWGACAAGADA